MIATDGDTGINTEICYKLSFESEKNCKKRRVDLRHQKITGFVFFFCTDGDFISIGEKDGKIDVKQIDRDAMKNEFYPFEVCESYQIKNDL